MNKSFFVLAEHARNGETKCLFLLPLPPLKCNITPFINTFTAGECVSWQHHKFQKIGTVELNAVGYQESKGKLWWPCYFTCSGGMAAIRTEEGERPLHSDNTPSLNMRFLAGSGTPASAEVRGESKLDAEEEKLASESNSTVEMFS